MTDLRLMAMDADDLEILSACCQDATIRRGDLVLEDREKRFVVTMNRFVWETAEPRRRFSLRRPRPFERRRSVLHFDRVLKVQHSAGLSRDAEAILVLLAIRFQPGETPSGRAELVFAGGSAIRLDLECIEAQLADTGAAWSTDSVPDHDRPDGTLLR